MTSWFMDTSALVKRYVRENGSTWIRNLAGAKENESNLSEITLPEVTAAIAAKARTPEGLLPRIPKNTLNL